MASSEPIPTIDCSGIPKNFQNFSTKLFSALKDKGVVYLVNHGLSPELLEAAYAKSREFFELPLETKMKYRKVDAMTNFHGFTPDEHELVHGFEQGVDSHTDFKEAWDACGPEAFDASKFPSEVPGLKKSYDDIRAVLVGLGKNLLKGIAIGLNLPDPDYFLSKHLHFDQPSIKNLELIRSYYYFPLGDKFGKGETRFSEHSDYGTLTFMMPEPTNAGNAFQVQDRDTKEWIPVPVKKDALILCAGVMMEMWTGGQIYAPRHRVIVEEETAHKVRLSVDYYIMPDDEVICLPLCKELEHWNPIYPKKRSDQTYHDYFFARLKGTRLDLKK